MNGVHIRRPARASLILAIAFSLPIIAQASETQTSSAGKGFGFAYDRAQEITLVGAVEQIVTHPAPGSAVGLHLLVSSEGKTMDVHLGPYLSPENREALFAGESVQVVGVIENAHGQDLFLARELIIGERKITIRNERGFLVRPPTRRANETSKQAANGGVQ